jgi:SAM-dependent methyltransferase
MLDQYMPATGRPLRILDLGCGTGKSLSDLQMRGHIVVGLDYSAEALRFTRQRGGRRLTRGDASRLPFVDGAFDVIIALDIMEHVERDDLMAAEIRRVLAPGGIAIINVPAHPFLWSGHDLALHHFRRYTRKTFAAILQGAGLKCHRFTYSICLLFLPALIYRLLYNLIRFFRPGPPASHVLSTGTVLNELFVTIVTVEASLMRRINMPMGLSLLAVVHDPARP